MTIPDIALQRSLGHIEAKLDELLRRAGETDKVGQAVNARLNSLENWRAYSTGAIVILAGAFGIGLKVLLSLL